MPSQYEPIAPGLIEQQEPEGSSTPQRYSLRFVPAGDNGSNSRINSARISRSSVTMDNPIARNAVDTEAGRLPWVTLGDPGLGVKVGTAENEIAVVCHQRRR